MECVTDEHSLLQVHVQAVRSDEQRKVGTMAPETEDLEQEQVENMVMERESQVQAELATKVLVAAKNALKSTQTWARLARQAAGVAHGGRQETACAGLTEEGCTGDCYWSSYNEKGQNDPC